MANKNHPGPFNCHAAALPDEPIFTLLGRDPAAPRTIKAWANERERLSKFETQEDRERLAEALVCADEMAVWRDINLDPVGDGTPSWRLPRNPVEEDERPTPVALYYAVAVDNPDDPEDDEYAVVFEGMDSPVCSVRAGMVVGGTREACLAQAHQIANALNGVTERPAIYDGYAEFADKLEPRIKNMHRLKAQTVRVVMQAPELGMPYGKANQVPERILHPAPAEPVPFEMPGEWQTEEDMTTAADLAAKPDVPPHRFAVMHKGRNYAYARGLEVNPIHLPVALDAMADDGWHLLAIFGQTDSQHVGFIFKRGDVPIEEIEYTLSPNRRHPPIDFGNHTRPQSDEMDAYQSGVPIDKIVGDMGRGLEP